MRYIIYGRIYNSFTYFFYTIIREHIIFVETI